MINHNPQRENRVSIVSEHVGEKENVNEAYFDFIFTFINAILQLLLRNAPSLIEKIRE